MTESVRESLCNGVGARAGGNRPRTSWTAGLAYVTAALLAVSCVSPPEGIEVITGRELDDVPVKPGLQFVESETFAPPLAEGTKFRSWVGVYRGKGLLQEIGPWYVGAMKDHGWTFTGAVESKGPEFAFHFVKRDEEAVIRVYRQYTLGTGQSVNMVRAKVQPRGTESFLPEDLESLKKTGVAWKEPAADAPVAQGTESQEAQAISFTAELDANPTTATSDFLLEPPTIDLETETPDARPPEKP